MSDNPAVWAKLFESMATANASFIEARSRASDWQLIILIQFLIKKGIIDANEIHDYIRSSTDEIEQLIAQSFDDEDLKRLHVNNFKKAMSVMMKDMSKE